MSAIPNEVLQVLIGDRKKLFNLRPHNACPLFDSVATYDVNGNFSRRVPLPRGMTPSEWRKYDCRTYTCRSIIWEYTPCGLRSVGAIRGPKVDFEHMHMIGDNAYSQRFGSCLACWKTKKRQFDDADKTPFPSEVGLDNPNLPRLGRCGCTICNNCVRLLELRRGNEESCPCPYCGNQQCFFKEIKIWSIGHEVFLKEAKRISDEGGANAN
jgi:hypothetical protein